MGAINGVEATDVAVVVLSVFAPAVLLVIVALLRGYNVRLWMWRDKKHDPTDKTPEE